MDTVTSTPPPADGGFFGSDGFTFDDLGSLLEMGTDTASSILGMTNPGAYAPAGAPYYAPQPPRNNTVIYLLAAVGVVMLGLIVWLLARK